MLLALGRDSVLRSASLQLALFSFVMHLGMLGPACVAVQAFLLRKLKISGSMALALVSSPRRRCPWGGDMREGFAAGRGRP